MKTTVLAQTGEAMTKPDAPRLALSRAEAAQSLGVSIDYLDEHVLPEVRVVRRGRRKLVPISELERWLRVNASLALDGGSRR